MQELNASSMVNVVWALAKTDYGGNGNRRSRMLLDNIAKAAMSHMEAFTPEQLSRLLWAFSTLHHYHADLYDAIAAETLQQVSSACNLFYSLILQPCACDRAACAAHCTDTLTYKVICALLQKLGVIAREGDCGSCARNTHSSLQLDRATTAV